MAKKEKLIPQSIETEEALLGTILTNPGAFDKISDTIDADDFYKPSNKAVYEAICALHDRNDAVDIVTVSEELKNKDKLESSGGRNFINELALNSLSLTSINIENYADIIKDKAVRRSLINAGSEIIGMAYDENDTQDILDIAERLVFNVATQKKQAEVQSITDLVMKAYEEIEYRYNHMNELSGTATGFYDFDQMTSGLQNSNLIILAARPAMGKTAFALNIAQNVALRTGKGVMIFSLEMSKVELMKRLLAAEAEVDGRRMTSGHLDANDWGKITSVMDVFSNAPIYIDDTGGQNISAIRAKCRKQAIKDPNLGLIVIDYLQLMEGTGSNPNNRNQEISAISRGLKTLARELNLPVIALSQLSRATEQRTDKRPMMSDLRDSGAIEQDADIVMFIHREEYYNKDNPELKGKAELIIAKNRSGPVDTIPLYFQANITKFKNPAKTATY